MRVERMSWNPEERLEDIRPEFGERLRPRVDARAFMLKDTRDRWRGALMTRDEDGAPMVRLNDPDGRPRLLGLLAPDGSIKFRLTDSSGVARINLELAPDGAPHVMVFGPDGHVRVQLRLTPENAPLVEIRDGERARFFTLEGARTP